MSTSACNFICHWHHKNCPSNTSVFQSQNLCECVTFHDRRDLKCDWVKGLEVRRWAWVYLRRPSLTTKVLKREGRDKRERERTWPPNQSSEWCSYWLKNEGDCESSKATAARFRRRGTCSPLGDSSRPPEGPQLCKYLDFSPVRPILDFCSSELLGDSWVEWLHSWWCYSSTWKLMRCLKL